MYLMKNLNLRSEYVDDEEIAKRPEATGEHNVDADQVVPEVGEIVEVLEVLVVVRVDEHAWNIKMLSCYTRNIIKLNSTLRLYREFKRFLYVCVLTYS